MRVHEGYQGGREADKQLNGGPPNRSGQRVARAHPSMAGNPLIGVLPEVQRRCGVRPTLGDSPHG
jgi:hypothetical protein